MTTPAHPDRETRETGKPLSGRPLPRAQRIVAIGGGKGGIGKSIIAATLGIELARRGLRTVLVDYDFGGPNLHSLLAMPFPRETLSEFVARRVESLSSLAVPTPVPGLSLIPGARSATQDAGLLHQQRTRLMRAISGLDADVVVLDLGAGTHYNVVDFFLMANHGILVVVPEATSVENAYRFLKVAFLRRLKNASLDENSKALILDAAHEGGALARTPAELLARITSQAPDLGRELTRVMATFRPELVVNQVRTAGDLTLGESMAQASQRLFGVRLDLLGPVHHCELLARAVRARLPVVFENLGREVGADIAQVAARLLTSSARAGEP